MHSSDLKTERTPDSDVASNLTHNLAILAVHHIVLRVAWIFKTESVIMPMFVDVISGQGWVRGCLPILNRFGQSIPPLYLADRLRATPLKKRFLLRVCLGMAAPFFLLSLIWLWTADQLQWWLPPAFLTLYFVFFSFNGLNQLAFGTLQGKLIPATKRGSLLGISTFLGAIFSILGAWWLLGRWLSLSDGGFAQIFCFAGGGFLAAGLLTVFVREHPDSYQKTAPAEESILGRTWKLYRHHVPFRRTATVAMLFISIQLLFPHYQALARGSFPVVGEDYMLWVVAQNAGAGIFSVLAGMIADRFGNRLAVRCEVLLGSLSPLLALVLASPATQHWFWLPYALLGLTPLTMKTLVNYTLELAEPRDHPRFVSSLSICFAVPFLLSPLVGLLVQLLGFTAIFCCISSTILIGGCLTFRMVEPRHQEIYVLPEDEMSSL